MGTRVVNGATGSEQVEREALFFAVLRERASSVGAVGSPGESAGRRLSRVDEEITAWLEEADEEGERILEQARTEAARLRLEAHHHAEQLRLAAERGAGDARRQRDTLLREGERAAAQRAAEAAEGAAAVLGDAERAADQRLVAADRASAWVRAQAEADARAATNRAAATVAGIQSEVRSLHEQLLSLSDACEVWPGHLGGSLCGGPGMDMKVASTIAYEQAHNRLLGLADEHAFVHAAVASLGAAVLTLRDTARH